MPGPCTRLFLLALLVCAGWARAQLFSHGESAEFILNTASPVQDTDGDGLPDWWEEQHFGSATGADANAVLTSDGLTNLEKYNGGWDPWVPVPTTLPHEVTPLFTLNLLDRAQDSDGDGLPDWWEELYFGGATAANAGAVLTDDRLTNLEKYNGGWDPLLPALLSLSVGATDDLLVDSGGWPGGYGVDTDGDGMPDWWEVKYGLDPLVDDAAGDLDGDGFSNLTEYLLGMNPSVNDLSGEDWEHTLLFVLDTVGRAPDTDGDGLPDWWEELHFGSITGADAHAVMTEDGLTNLEKYNGGWDPWVPILPALSRATSEALNLLDTGGWPGGYGVDSDEDGMPDWWEVKYGLNPLLDDAAGDLDGDGLSNLTQYLMGLVPFADNLQIVFKVEEGNIFLLDTGGFFKDEDGDGIPDWWERRYTGLNTGLDASALTPAGHTLRQSFIADLDPGDPDASFKVQETDTEVHEGESAIVIRWQSSHGRVYKVFASDDLSTPWPTEAIYTTQGNGSVQSCAVIVDDTQPYFFKVSVEVVPE